MIAIIIVSKKVGTMTEAGAKMFLCYDEWGVTTSRYLDGDKLRSDAKIFPDEETAKQFMKSWSPHPWWCSPKKFHCMQVEKSYVQVHDGFITSTREKLAVTWQKWEEPEL